MIALRKVYGEMLVHLGEKYKNIVVLDADLSKSTKTDNFAKKFPERFFDVGISEADMMSTAAGISLTGNIPFASTFAIFGAGRAWEQIRNSICYANLHVIIVVTHAGITVGPDGGSHQSISDIALMRVLPNMKVLVPADKIELEEILEYVINQKGPYYIRLGRNSVPDIHTANYRFREGRGGILREGNDITIIGTGYMVSKSLEAADILEKNGYSIRVVNISTIKPIDKDLIIDSVEKTGAIVSVEEHSIIGGLGGAIAEVMASYGKGILRIVGIDDRFGQSGGAEDLLLEYGLTSDNIVRNALDILHS